MEIESILADNRDRLRRLVHLRIDPRLAKRVDASDVIQEAFIDANRRFEEFESQREVSPYVWLRFLVCQKLAQLHRAHLGVKARDAARDVSIDQQRHSPMASTAMLAAQLADDEPTPSQVAVKSERQLRLQELLDQLDDLDREIIALRHFEHLDNREAAQILGISVDTAYKRYIRALKRIRHQVDASNW